MAKKKVVKINIQLRSIEEPDIDIIHVHQNTDCIFDLSGLLGNDLPWAPLSKAQIRKKIETKLERERTSLFGILVEDTGLVGLGYFSAGWDPWSPSVGLIIWPEYRRQGYGTEAALLLLKHGFEESLAHVINAENVDWNPEGIKFILNLGFKESGLARRDGLRHGQFFDTLYFDMLRKEYNAKYGMGGER